MRILLLAAAAIAGPAATLFQENFTTPGIRLDLAAWTTESGPVPFLGLTQLADWVTQGGIGQFKVDSHQSLSAYNRAANPTGLLIYGTHGKTLPRFKAHVEDDCRIQQPLRLTAVQPAGLVYSKYFYECIGPTCATDDEVDIELPTKQLPLKVQLN